MVTVVVPACQIVSISDNWKYHKIKLIKMITRFVQTVAGVRAAGKTARWFAHR